jgi:hypothetical protein
MVASRSRSLLPITTHSPLVPSNHLQLLCPRTLSLALFQWPWSLLDESRISVPSFANTNTRFVLRSKRKKAPDLVTPTTISLLEQKVSTAPSGYLFDPTSTQPSRSTIALLFRSEMNLSPPGSDDGRQKSKMTPHNKTLANRINFLTDIGR